MHRNSEDAAISPHNLAGQDGGSGPALQSVLNAGAVAAGSHDRQKLDPRSRAYGSGVRQALPLLWDAAGRVCGKRLQPILPALLSAMELAGEIEVDDSTREELGRISAASIDRFLLQARNEASAEPLCAFRNLLASQGKSNPTVRMNVDTPGTAEAILTKLPEGSSATIRSLLLVDVATGWAEYEELIGSSPADLVRAVESVHIRAPFLLKRIFAGNSRFFSSDFLTYCRHRSIELVESADRTQQVCSAESGCCHREHHAIVQYHNFFHASFRLKSRVIKDSRVVRVHSRPETPYRRLLTSDEIPQPEKDRLQAQFRNANPATLLRRRKAATIYRD